MDASQPTQKNHHNRSPFSFFSALEPRFYNQAHKSLEAPMTTLISSSLNFQVKTILDDPLLHAILHLSAPLMLGPISATQAHSFIPGAMQRGFKKAVKI